MISYFSCGETGVVVGLSRPLRDLAVDENGETWQTVAKRQRWNHGAFISCRKEYKLGAGDENRTRVLSLGS
jgi:hypothetical protein